MMLQQVVGGALTKLVRKLRRYFPAGAPACSRNYQDRFPEARSTFTSEGMLHTIPSA